MSGKQQKFLTIMIIPHSGQAVVNWRIPATLLKAAGWLVIFVLIVGIAFGKSYYTLKENTAKMAELQKENAQQQRQIHQFAQQANTIQQQLAVLQQLDNQVRSMMNLQKPESAAPASQSNKLQPVTSRAFIVRQTALNFNRIEQDGLVKGTMIVETDDTQAIITQLEQELAEFPAELEQCQQSLTEVENTITYQQEKLAATPSIVPTYGRVTSDFGYRKHPIFRRTVFHDGIDIAAPRGTLVRAAGDGIVAFAGRKNGYGNTIMINHGFGYTTLYAHNSELLVESGDKVKKGDIIAKVGSTGSSTGSHLHYEVHVNGSLQDPTNYF